MFKEEVGGRGRGRGEGDKAEEDKEKEKQKDGRIPVNYVIFYCRKIMCFYQVFECIYKCINRTTASAAEYL